MYNVIVTFTDNKAVSYYTDEEIITVTSSCFTFNTVSGMRVFIVINNVKQITHHSYKKI